MAYEVKIAFVITKDGADFHRTDLAYSNMDYDDVVGLEGVGATCIQALNDFGKEKAKAKKQK